MYLLGFDYWVKSDIYLALEYGVNCDFQYSGSQEQTLMNLNDNRLTWEKITINKPYYNFQIRNYASPFIRVCWRFYHFDKL